jgi:uncharacterized protein
LNGRPPDAAASGVRIASMGFGPLPRSAAWLHRDARDGFEVVGFTPKGSGHRIEGHSAAVEGGEVWVAHYAIEVDRSWATLGAHVSGGSGSGAQELVLETDGHGGWLMNGEAAQHLQECLDVDLEASACTNALPVHRLGLEIGNEAEAPAVYVRAVELSVERLEQTYRRLDDRGERQRYRYTAPAFDFEAELVYDECGLVLDYPGIAVRAS